MGDGDRATGGSTASLAGGVVALHGAQNALPVLAAPALEDKKNTVKAGIIPFACWRVDDVRFDFDSSSVKPDVGPEMDALGKLVDQNSKEGKKPLASVFGHADPTGKDDYNKVLSGRRAKAIYALLTRNTDMWEELFKKPHGGDDWAKNKVVDGMLGTLGFGTTIAEKKRFQSENGLQPDGDIGPKSRKQLFQSYMDALSAFKLEKTDFLGQGQDDKGKADFQGCSEFNPQRVFSTDESKAFEKDHASRDAENVPNRRVMVFLFRPGTQISLDRWPCPRADEGVEGCKKRFWSDGDTRRNPQDARREFKDTKNTFACRFYHRLSDSSPCEGVIPVLRLRLYDDTGAFIENAPYRITVGGETRAGVASPKGEVTERFQDVPPDGKIEWGKADPAKPGPPADGDKLPFETQIFLGMDPNDDSEALAKQRLHNLGYVLNPTEELNIKAFQSDFRESFSLQVNGKLDDITRDALRVVHNRCEDNLTKTAKS